MHQAHSLMPIEIGDLPDFFIRQPLLIPSIPLLENAENAGLRCFPVDALIPFRMTRTC